MKPIRVSILTLTGGRPEAFALCKKYIERQRALRDDTHYQFEWIILDDEVDAYLPVITQGFTGETDLYNRRTYLPWDGKTNTFNKNLREGLNLCAGELIAFMEDDDWYSPHYLLNMLDIYRTANIKPRIIGSSPATYYNVRTGEHAVLDNIFHASLAETIIHRSLVPICNEILSKADTGITFFDVQLWREARLRQALSGEDFWLGSAGHSVGIKGMPGRRGIGVGHLDHPEWERDTPDLEYLRRRIGAEDTEAYAPFRDHNYERSV